MAWVYPCIDGAFNPVMWVTYRRSSQETAVIWAPKGQVCLLQPGTDKAPAVDDQTLYTGTNGSCKRSWPAAMGLYTAVYRFPGFCL